MKIILKALMFATLHGIFSRAESNAKGSISGIVNRPTDENAAAAGKTVVKFLEWYKSNFEKLK